MPEYSFCRCTPGRSPGDVLLHQVWHARLAAVRDGRAFVWFDSRRGCCANCGAAVARSRNPRCLACEPPGAEDTPYIGGPLAGTATAGGLPAYRSAKDGSPLDTSYGDRWLLGARYGSIEPRVQARAAGIYAHHHLPDGGSAYVWGPVAGEWRTAGRPAVWPPDAEAVA